jgi:hypothetical protein
LVDCLSDFNVDLLCSAFVLFFVSLRFFFFFFFFHVSRQELLGLVKWFEKKDDAMIREALERAPSDAVAFRVFWSVRQVVLLLNRMSNLQILHLGDEMIPPGSEEMQVSFLAAWQQELQHWSTERVRELHSVVHATPIHLERQRVSGVVQQAQFVEITLSVLKLPLEQLVSFHVWFCGLGPSLLKQLVLLLTSMSSAQLIELRSLLLLPSMQQPGQQPDSVVEPVRPVLVARDELVNSLMSGFSPDASYPTHVGGPMKVCCFAFLFFAFLKKKKLVKKGFCWVFGFWCRAHGHGIR